MPQMVEDVLPADALSSNNNESYLFRNDGQADGGR
jgi:hypothetical protein